MRLQLFATFTQTLHRLFNKSFDDLLTSYTHHYDGVSMTKTQGNTEQWGEFLKQYQQSKDIAQTAIFNQLEQVSPNIELIENALAAHEQRIAALWLQGFKTILELKIQKPDLLGQWVATMKDLRDADKTIIETRHVTVINAYDSEHAGRTAIFKSPPNLSRWRDNFRAWSRGEGLLFPNFHAWWIGELSTRNYLSQLPLFNFILSPVEEETRVKSQVNASHAAIWKILNQNKGGSTVKSQEKIADNLSNDLDDGEKHSPDWGKGREISIEEIKDLPNEINQHDETKPPPGML